MFESSNFRDRYNKQYRPYAHCNKFIFDVDPGCDDAQFLITAIHIARKLGKEIIGITCVDGNTELKDGVLNTLIVLKLCNAPIKIYKGSCEINSGAKVNLQGFISKSVYFGQDGLGNQQAKYEELITPDYWELIQEESAFEFISRSAKRYREQLGIICTGPLTNIAISWMLNNELPSQIGEITAVGGSYTGVGVNTAYCTEFNFNADADAAALVLKWFRNITLVPLELAFETPQTEGGFAQFFTSEATEKARFIKDIFQNIKHLVFDPVAAFAVFMPKTVLGVYRVYGEVNREGSRTKGFLSIDWLRTKEKNEPNLQIINRMDWKVIADVIRESVQDQPPKLEKRQPSTYDSP